MSLINLFHKKRKGYQFTDEDRALAIEKKALKLKQEENEMASGRLGGLADDLQNVKTIADMMGWNEPPQEGNELVELAKMAMAQRQTPTAQPQQPAAFLDQLIAQLPAELIANVKNGKVTEKLFIKESEPFLKSLYSKIVGR